MSARDTRSAKAVKIFQYILPSPFTIAIVLSIITLLLAVFLTRPENTSIPVYFIDMVAAWEKGLWDSSGGGLYFAFQMMLILVLGHILALTPQISKLIQSLLKLCTNTASSAVIVSLGAMLLGLINWGLGLIFGAVLARKVGEKFSQEGKPLNYGLIGAAGYATMMTWHMGLSGSATTKSMESGYLQEMMSRTNFSGELPNHVPFEQTIGSSMNISMILISLILIPLVLYWIARKNKNEKIPSLNIHNNEIFEQKPQHLKGAARLDYSRYFAFTLGIGFLIFAVYQAITFKGISALGFINLNFINFVFLGLSLMLHRSIDRFLQALQTAIGDISGILIQFPFYFGILGIMTESGLISLLSNSITSIADSYTLPLFTFLSAGLVNFFIPSGGGQWAVQGPIIIETVNQLQADLAKSILAMAYGDQLTNMLQPFWALPLLGITKLKPQDVLPYSFIIFLIGLIVFGVGLLIF